MRCNPIIVGKNNSNHLCDPCPGDNGVYTPALPPSSSHEATQGGGTIFAWPQAISIAANAPR